MVDSRCRAWPCTDSPTFLDIFAENWLLVGLYVKSDTTATDIGLRDTIRSEKKSLFFPLLIVGLHDNQSYERSELLRFFL